MSKQNAYKRFTESIKQYKYPKPKTTALSRAQQAALAKGRGFRTQSLLNKYYEEAKSRYIDTANPMQTRRKYINELRYVSKAEGISIKEAHDVLMHTFPYISKEDNYKYQIFQYVDKNELRRRIADATGQSYTVINKPGQMQGRVRVTGGLSLTNVENEFAYDPGSESLVGSFTNPSTGQSTIIHIRIVEGQTSDSPNFVVIS